MKIKNLGLALGAVLGASAIIAGSTARAEDVPQTKIHQEFSVTQGFSEPAVAVLQRASMADQKQVSSDLIKQIRPAGAYLSTKHGSKLLITGRQWSLEVADDAAAAEYRNRAVAARAHSLSKPLSEKMSAAQLEQKGRAFIASKLASQIVLGADEDLIVLRADYRTEGGKDLATGKISRAISGNRIVFGRTVRGVPVVGSGSKVILTFINDGSLESFRYDWPEYRSVATQNVVAAGEILSRVQKVIAVHNGVDTPTSAVTVPSGEGDAYPLALTPNTQLQALDCGYYDAGSLAGRTKFVQPGCTYLAFSEDKDGMRDGYAGAVPAAAHFELDPRWTETQILARK